MSQFSKFLTRLGRDERGATVTVFALAFLPALLFSAVAIDGAWMLRERVKLQTALDATLISAAKMARTAKPSDVEAGAQTFFAAAYGPLNGRSQPKLKLQLANEVVTGDASISIPLNFARLLGRDATDVGAHASVSFKAKKIEIALALDNTGSMGWSGKMDALKAAVDDLVVQARAMSPNPGDVKISLVPFNTQVRIDTAYAGRSWLRFDQTLENPNYPWIGIDPTPPTVANWTGCLSDRDQPYDGSGAAPWAGAQAHVAARCHFGDLASITPLTGDLESVRAKVATMVPTGATNVTIGLAMGLSTLDPATPFGTESSNSPNVQKFLVLLTDGDNTQNRWGGNGGVGNAYATTIDDRLRAACAAAPAGVRRFTIRVIDGNASLLRDCASTSGDYFDVSDASQLQPVFRAILKSIQSIYFAS